jgi:hypothetical protein
MKVESRKRVMKQLTKMQLGIFYDTHYFPKMPWWPPPSIVWPKYPGPDLTIGPRVLLGAAVSHVPSITGPVIYAIGGCTGIMTDPYDPSDQLIDDTTVTGRTERYAPQTGIWEEKASMNTPRSGLAAVAAGGKIYAIGGDWEGSVPDLDKGPGHWYPWTSGTVEEYNPGADTWTPKPNVMPHPRTCFGAAATSDGKIWVIGGLGPPPGYAIVGQVDCYNTLTNNWEGTWEPMHTPRQGLAVVAASNGKIYAIGGIKETSEGYGEEVSTVEEFDPAKNEWAPKADMHSPRYDLAAVAASNGKIYAMGGINLCAALGSVEEYDPNTDTWKGMGPMNTGRYWFGAAATDDGKIYVIGGASLNPFGLLASVEVVTVRYGPVHIGHPSSSSGSVDLTHEANVLVVVDVAYNRDSMKDPIVTVGGAAATQVGYGTDADGMIACASYVCFRSAAGTDSVAASFSASGTWCMTVQGLTGTPKSPPFTETVVTGGASTGTSIALSVGAGTAGRRVHMAVCVNYKCPTYPDTGQTEVDDYPVPGDGRSVESNYRDIDGAVTMGASWSSEARNASIAYGILRSP